MATQPALYEHCLEVYTAMAEKADYDENDNTVYEGFLTKLFEELRLAVPYYTEVMRLLKTMDCVRQERRGGGSAPSRWVLLQEPYPELFAQHYSTPKTQRDDHLIQMINDLNARVGRLENAAIG